MGGHNGYHLIHTYVQLFRDGVIEAVVSGYIYFNNDRKYLGIHSLEEDIVKHSTEYLSLLKELNINPPYLMMLSLLNTNECRIEVHLSRFDPIVRSAQIILPDILIEKSPEKISTDLRPLFDLLWNAFGFPDSPNYDKEGNWRRKPYLE